MKKKLFRKLLLRVYEQRKADQIRNVNFKLTFNLPVDDVDKIIPFAPRVSDDDSNDGKGPKIIYNAREIMVDESDCLDTSGDGDDNTHTCDETLDNDHDLPDLVPERTLHEINEPPESIKTTDRIDGLIPPKDLVPEHTLHEICEPAKSKDTSLILDPNDGLPLFALSCWLPLYVDGVCRFIGKLSTRRTRRLAEVVTEAVSAYSVEKRIVITGNCRYDLIGEMNGQYLAGVDFIESRLTQDGWLHSVVVLSQQLQFAEFASTNLKGFSDRKITGHKTKQMSTTNKKAIIRKKTNSPPLSADTDIRLELDDILALCQNGGDWHHKMEEFMQKYNQTVDSLEETCYCYCDATDLRLQRVVDEGHISRRTLISNVDNYDSENYETFVVYEDMFNSTIKESATNLYLWSIMKNQEKRFCITGLKNVGKRYLEVAPTLIKSVTNDGTCVLTTDDNYTLVGPLYKLSLYCCYPNSENSEYMDLFQCHFLRGLPKYWKAIATVAHIVCGVCTHLRKVTEDIALTLDLTPVRDKSPNSISCLTEGRDTLPLAQENDPIITPPPPPPPQINSPPSRETLPQAQENDPIITPQPPPQINSPPVIKRKAGRKPKKFTEGLETLPQAQENNPIITPPPPQMNSPPVIRRKAGRKPKKKVTKKGSKKSAQERANDSEAMTTSKTIKRKSSMDAHTAHHKSLRLIHCTSPEESNFTFQPPFGQPVDLTRIPITRSGRVSLPPPNPFSRSLFKRVGDDVHLISNSRTTMVFRV